MLSIRTANLSAEDRKRQRLVMGGGSLVIAALAGSLLLGDGDGPVEPSVELQQQPAQTANPPPPPVIAPPAPAPPVVPAPAAAAYQLVGIGGGGEKGRAAILAMPSGGQRVVPVGRAVAPGVTMKEVGLTYAILSSPSGDIRLEFRKAAAPVTSASSAAAGASRTNTIAPAIAAVNAQHQQNNMHYRLGMEPRKVGPNILGYRIKQQGHLPVLTQAGLRPGDILISVNNEMIDDEERLSELSEKLANEPVARIEIERNGRRQKIEIKSSIR
jgi:type II secretion system protein C